MKQSILFTCTLFLLMVTMAPAQKGSTADTSAIDISDFYDSSHHWYDITDEDKIIIPEAGQKRYAENDIRHIADNILLYQKTNGGWPKNYDMLAVLSPAEQTALRSAKHETNTTFDNGATHSQIVYLARAADRLKERQYQNACLKGISFILEAQYANGGWPQFFPDTTGYARYITFNDDAMIGIMKILRDIVYQHPMYRFVPPALRARVTTAFSRGVTCILKTQINDDGQLTAWCQQYHHQTLASEWARTFEPPSICNGESSEIVLFLMSLRNPSPEIINAVNSAVRWFEQSKLSNTRVETIPYPETVYKYRTSKIDKVVVHDTTAKPIWARYYEMRTHRPLFCGRNSKPVYSMAEVEHERRSGYRWYVYDPQSVLDAYPAWKARCVK